jgi:enoyl-CoA hydratase/carnithine racemase
MEVLATARRQEPLAALAAELDTTLVIEDLPELSTVVVLRDIEAEISRIVQIVAANPRAALSAMRVLRSTEQLSVADGLNLESAVYSMLLAGPEFARWRSGRPRVRRDRDSNALTVYRVDDCLTVTLNRPGRSNAIDRFLRDELIDALDLAIIDETISSVILRGAGESFSGGGDLDEFGSVADVSAAHLIRLDRSVAMRVEQCRERVVVRLHGGCVGFGIEVPSFAARVTAAPDMFAQLPEVAMGLIPGAGGTVGVTRRIRRWRTAYMLLSGARIDAATAHGWGLVDDIDVS